MAQAAALEVVEHRPKRTHGRGTVEQLSSGRWRFRISTADGKRRSSPTYDTRGEAEAILAAALEELALGNMAPVGTMTLGAYAQRYLDRLTTCSAKDVRGRWRLHVEGSDLAKLPIAEVKRRHVRDFVAQLAVKKKMVAKAGAKACEKVEGTDTISPQSQKHVLALLSRVFNEARADDLIETNPCEGVRVARVEDCADETWSFLSIDEIDRLLTHPEIPDAKRLIFATAIYTALREGELWALRWRDLDLDGPNPTCACRRSYQKGTKANKVRRFPLLPAAVETLRRVRERSTDASPDALVFPRPDGKMYSKGYDAEWRRWSKRAGIREEVRFHDLRHTCASHLAMGSWGRAWTLSEVRDFIGHASISMTERYSHLGPGHLHAIASATNEKIVRALSKEEPPASVALVAAGRKAEEADAELGNSCSIQLSYAVVSREESIRTLPRGQSVDNLSQVARAVLTLAAAGVPVPEVLVDQLAQQVLRAPAVELARAVAEGGPHKLLRAVELAEVLMREKMGEGGEDGAEAKRGRAAG